MEEFEALRLKDVHDLHQEECARHMGVSQSTFQRIITSVRKKISCAIINGHAIRIAQQ